ncbi:MAG TPA: surface-adhesin E family protein [Syntrophales bacterium]|nr:surface-adhesin E family protein [Syntrophales bacterium]
MERNTLRMILGLVTLFIFPTACEIQAAEWIFYGETGSGHLYYDNTSIMKSGNNVQVRTMAIFGDDGKATFNHALKKIGKAPGNADVVSYSISSEQFDCVKNKLKLSSMTIYNEKGGAIHSMAMKNDDWDDIIPETNGDNLRKIVCSGL